MIEPTDGGMHKLVLEGRKKLFIQGVEDVISFEECILVLKTVMGIMSIDGSELRITDLNLDRKEIEIEGTVNGIIYQGARPQKSGLFKRKE